MAENTERVERQKEAAITVIIGNPPYNVGQKSENDNNQNRKYKEIDQRIRETYAKDSKPPTRTLSDMYVNFFRWASDRLGDRDGIVCLVSNTALSTSSLSTECANIFAGISSISITSTFMAMCDTIPRSPAPHTTYSASRSVSASPCGEKERSDSALALPPRS